VVGIYRLADRVVDLVLELTTRPVGLVALPLFSRLRQDREQLRGAVATCTRLTLVAAVPALLLVVACSDFLLAVVGPEWEAGADALALLAVAGIGKAVVAFTGPLLFALGRAAFRAAMLWILGAASAAAVVVVGGLLETASAEDQLLGVSASRALLFLLVFVPVSLLVVRAATGFGLRAFLALAAPPVAAGAAAIAVVLALREATPIETAPPVAGLAVAVVVGGATALAALLALDAGSRRYARGLTRLAASWGGR
jgi:PST family polysaccharide transporter